MKNKFKLGDLVRFQRWGVGDPRRTATDTLFDNGVIVGFADRGFGPDGALMNVDVPAEQGRLLRIVTPDGEEHMPYIRRCNLIAKGNCK